MAEPALSSGLCKESSKLGLDDPNTQVNDSGPAVMRCGRCVWRLVKEQGGCKFFLTAMQLLSHLAPFGFLSCAYWINERSCFASENLRCAL